MEPHHDITTNGGSLFNIPDRTSAHFSIPYRALTGHMGAVRFLDVKRHTAIRLPYAYYTQLKEVVQVASIFGSS